MSGVGCRADAGCRGAAGWQPDPLSPVLPRLILSASPRWVPARRSSVSPGCGLCFPAPLLCQSLTGRLLAAVCSSCMTPNPLMSKKENTSLDILKNPLRVNGFGDDDHIPLDLKPDQNLLGKMDIMRPREPGGVKSQLLPLRVTFHCAGKPSDPGSRHCSAQRSSPQSLGENGISALSHRMSGGMAAGPRSSEDLPTP